MKYLGYPGKPEALEISRQMTRLFSQKYGNAIWTRPWHPSEFLPSTSPSLASSASWHGAWRASPQSQDCTLKYLDHPGKPEALEISRQTARLFSQKYGNAIWNATLASIRVPAFDNSVADIIGFVAWGMEGFTPIPGLPP